MHPNPPSSALFSHCVPSGSPSRDVGSSSTACPQPGEILESSEQAELEKLEALLGNKEVSSSKLDVAPPWLKAKALNEELQENWKNAYKVVPEHSVPKTANVVRSHVIYKVKRKERHKRRLKARLCAQGNHD